MNNTLLLQQFDLLATAPGGVAKLRELILTLAVQGKLVPQNPTDEPASALLKRIRAEKDRLIAEGKIKRDKPLAPIGEDEQPFGLPVGWVWARLGRLANFIDYRGKTPTKTVTGISLITAKNVRQGFINRQPREFIAEADYAGWMTRGFPKVGDLLFTTEAPLGNVAVIDIQEPFALAQRVICFGLYEIKMSGALAIFLRSPWMQSVFAEQATGVTAQGIKSARLQKIPIPIPPLAEQARIATRVEELMRVCDALEATGQRQATHHRQLVQTLLGDLTADSHTPWQRVSAHFDTLLDRPSAVDALEQTILQLAVRGQLVPQDPTDEPASELLKRIRAEKDRLIAEGKIKRDKPLAPIGVEEQSFELPAGWEWVKVGQIAKRVQYGVTASADHTQAEPKFVRITDIQNDNVNWETVPGLLGTVQDLSEHFLGSGDLLIARTGGTIGKSFLVPTVPVNAVFASYLIRISPLPGVDPEYLKVFASSGHYWQQLYAKAMGTGQPNVNGTALSELTIPLPPLPEQARIVARVAQLRRLCADLRQRLTQSQTTQAALAEALVAQLP